MDPLGAEVGTFDPVLITPTSYSDIHGDTPMFMDGGDPFHLSDGCGDIDGMPASCSEISERTKNGTAVYDAEEWGRTGDGNGGLKNYVRHAAPEFDQTQSNLSVLDAAWVPDYNDASGDYVNDKGQVVGVISGRYVSTGTSRFTTSITPRALQRIPLTGDGLDRFKEDRTELLKLLRNRKSDCAKYLMKTLGLSASRVADAVLGQRVFDGTASTLSMEDAGLLPRGYSSSKSGFALSSTMSVQSFFALPIAAAVTAKFIKVGTGATLRDVYYNPNNIDQVTILHETLHMFLGQDDPGLGVKANYDSLIHAGCGNLGKAF
jgi:hypothetical protein